MNDHIFFNDVYRIENEFGQNKLQEKNSEGIEMKEMNQNDEQQKDNDQTQDPKEGQTVIEEETETETDPLSPKDEFR